MQNYKVDNIHEDEKKPKKKISKLKVFLLLLIICIPIGVFGTIMYRGYIKTNQAYNKVEREYTNLAMSYVSEYKDKTIKDKNMRRKVDFAKLQKQEPDIYAWIHIPDTNVNYPILQSGTDKDNDDYWLNHNLDGTTGYPGTIFTEEMFGKNFTTFNTVIYGHNMKNQTMFGELHNFEESKKYFDKHQYVYIYTQYNTYKYQIICASTISDTHLAVAYNSYNTEQQRQQFIDYLLGSSKYSRNLKTGIYDNYITLSTCTSSDTNRFVVLGKCVNKTKVK